MATKTRAEMINWVLEHLGVKAATATVTAEDSTAAGRVIDSVHARLRREGLAPFATSAFPEWAQQPFVDIVAPELAGTYLIGGERLQRLEIGREHGRREIARQVASMKHPIRTKGFYF